MTDFLLKLFVGSLYSDSCVLKIHNMSMILNPF